MRSKFFLEFFCLCNQISLCCELTIREAVHPLEIQLRELMLRGLAGDAQAQRSLLTQLAERLRLFHRRRLAGHAADVEDLVQETLIAIHTRRGTYDPAQPFTAWVYALARYKLIDHLRRRRAHLNVPLEDCEELLYDDHSDAVGAASDVATLLADLPDAQRAAIRLTRIEGLSVEEAAAQSGQSISSIKVGVHRGLKKLSALFAGEDRHADE